jgi:hypothetical protein
MVVLVITTPQAILTLDISNNTWKPSSLGAVKINIGWVMLIIF